MSADPEPILEKLVQCVSVTPDEGGALDCLEDMLKPVGFDCTRLTFSDQNTPDVDNLFARFSNGGKHLCFAGHTDVVPPGDEVSWNDPPFTAVIKDGKMFGRGTSDMKGSVAAFVAATQDFLTERGDAFDGSISFLITGDEEGPAINGTVKVLDWMKKNNHMPDHCLVGEPTSSDIFGDVIKVGRRGSVHFDVTVTGVQGHSAYMHLADNPVPKLARLIDRLASASLDNGNENFEASTLAVTTFDVGNSATNVTPQKASAHINVRYNTEQTANGLFEHVKEQVKLVEEELGGEFHIEMTESADAFLCSDDALSTLVAKAIKDETGIDPKLGTGGGTSDARFIKDFCPVLEFGPLNTTIHQVNEHIILDDLHSLTRVYKRILDIYFD